MENNLGQVVLVKDINPGASNYGYAYGFSYPSSLTEFNDKLYFSANDGENGNELWVSDGTTAGTSLVEDIRPGTNNYDYTYGSNPSSLTEFNGKLYFSANDGENGNELWVTDGTTAGTSLLVDIRPGTSNYGYGYSSNPSSLTEFNGKLYFSANDGENGNELWVTDGTTAGTSLLVDIRPGTSNYGYGYSSYPSSLTEFNGKLYFSANDGNGNELWVSDGTTGGTSLLVDINPGTSNYGYSDGSYPSNFIEFNDKLYFTADDGENGSELWVTDGTTAGTSLLIDIRPDTSNYGYAYSSYVSYLTEFNDKLYFSANDGENGNELWVTDGTTAGTSLLIDIRPDTSNYGYAYGSNPSNLTEFNDKLYFSANDGENGNELWVTDGTTAGTKLVANVRPSAVGSSPGNLTVVGDELFFSADNGDTGIELFKLTLAGEDGKDILTGGNGKDILTGGDGKDILTGGNGKDILTGGNGKDVFVIKSGSGEDTIADFELGSDRFGLSQGLEFDDLTFSGNKISIGDEILVNVTGVNTEQFTAGDFDIF